MSDRARLLVLCPSYRRPIAAQAVSESFLRTSTCPTTKLTFLLYEDDEDSENYLNSEDSIRRNAVLCPEKDMVPRVNGALDLLDDFTHVGWIADDNRFETPGWDHAVLKALGSHPIVFCNDTVSPGAKPSHVFMDARIPNTLGWLILPGLHSTFADDVWANLGVGPIDVTGPLSQVQPNGGLGIAYLHGVRIPHLYIEKTSEARWVARGNAAYKVHNEGDLDRYRHWLRHEAENDIAKARRGLRETVSSLRP